MFRCLSTRISKDGLELLSKKCNNLHLYRTFVSADPAKSQRGTIPKHKLKHVVGKNTSSTNWLRRQLSDQFVKKAQIDGFRSRAAYKLQEIDDKYKFLKPQSVVIDLGASPGGWTQIATQRVQAKRIEPKSTTTTSKNDSNKNESSTSIKPNSETPSNEAANGKEVNKPRPNNHGIVISVDIESMQDVEQATIVRGDFNEKSTKDKILSLLGTRKADTILSDMAPNATGMRDIDHSNLIDLAKQALMFSDVVLRGGGTFLIKISRGGEEDKFKKLMEKKFKSVKYIKPEASRKSSAEIYLLGSGFVRPTNSQKQQQS